MPKHHGRGTCIDCGRNPAYRGRRCPPCSDKHFIMMKDRQNEMQKAARAAKRADNPTMCVDGCGRPAVGYSVRCDECRVAYRKAYKAAYQLNRKAEERACKSAATVTNASRVRPPTASPSPPRA